MARPYRLLSIAHSYVVTLNRRLANEMARVGAGKWEVTAIAPPYFHGGRDLRPVTLAEAKDETCRLVTINAYFTRKIHAFFYGRQLRSLLSQQWDLVHCWEEPYVLAGSQAAWWTPRRIPFVFWTAQNISKRYPPPFNFFERYCLHRCAGWMACGQSIVDTLLPRGYNRKPHRIMPLGVDLEAFSPDAEARAAVRRGLGWDTDGPPIVGYLGRFTPEKGPGFLMRVLDGLHTPWRALFVGTGEMETELRSWGKSHGDRVRICTDVGHADVPRYLNAMDVLCAPSQTTARWREQFGRMLIEAFSCGIPVIGSDSGEIPHVMGDAGIIVGENNEAGWQDALETLLNDPVQRQELSKRGRERAHARYAWSVVARQHLAFFDQILDERNHRAG